MVPFFDDFCSKELPVVNVLAELKGKFPVDISKLGVYFHRIENDVADIKVSQNIRSTKLIGLSFRFLELQSVENTVSDIGFLDRLLQGFTVVVNESHFVEEVGNLSSDDRGEGVVISVDGTRSENGHVGEGLFDDGLSLVLGLEVKGVRVRVGSCCRKVDQSMDSVLGTSLGDSFCDFNIDEFEILSFLEALPGTDKIDNYIGVLDHILDHLLIFEVHVPLQPRLVRSTADFEFLEMLRVPVVIF